MIGFGHRALIISTHLLVATFLIGALTFLAETEASWYPVVTDTRIDSARMEGDSLVINGTFDKVRGYCVIQSSSIFMETDGTLVPMERANRENVKDRPEGKQSFGDWVIKDYTPGSRLVVTTVHKCHPLWYTDSIFYDGVPIEN